MVCAGRAFQGRIHLELEAVDLAGGLHANSYKGWLKYADTFRLYQKYVVPLLPYADDYYIRNIKPNTKKGLNAA